MVGQIPYWWQLFKSICLQCSWSSCSWLESLVGTDAHWRDICFIPASECTWLFMFYESLLCFLPVVEAQGYKCTLAFLWDVHQSLGYCYMTLIKVSLVTCNTKGEPLVFIKPCALEQSTLLSLFLLCFIKIDVRVIRTMQILITTVRWTVISTQRLLHTLSISAWVIYQ